MKGMSLKKMMGGLKKMSLENVVILVLLVVLVILVVHCVNKNNEGFGNNTKPEIILFLCRLVSVPYLFFSVENVFNDKTWKTVNGHEKVELVKVNHDGGDEEKKLAKEYNVKAYPDLVKDNGSERVEFEEGVSGDVISEFINKM